MIESIAIIFLGFAGFFLASFLHHKKKRKSERLVCPFKGSCTEVIRSDFSSFLKIPVEVLGMLYYLFIAIGYAVVLMLPMSIVWIDVILFLASAGAFLFSAYLTFIQLFSLRKICTWCLLSATISTFIFLFSFFGVIDLVFPLLLTYRSIIIGAHVMFMALGIGAATLADVFFFRFLKDFKISQEETNVLTVFSEFIWLVLGGILLTGFALYLPESVSLNETPKFLLKALVVGVIIVNGAFLNLVISPKLVKISFGERHEHQPGELARLRRIAFALGPISITSWYSAFLLGLLPGDLPLSFTQLLLIYLAFAACGITGGQVYDFLLTRRAHAEATANT